MNKTKETSVANESTILERNSSFLSNLNDMHRAIIEKKKKKWGFNFEEETKLIDN